MTVLVLVLASIVVAALVLAVNLLRPEPVSEQGLADLSRSLAGGRDYEQMGSVFEERLSADKGPLMRKYLMRLRGDFLTAWAVCRLLGPISQEADPGPGLFRCWLRFHALFAVIWVRTYLGQGAQTDGQIDSLTAVFGDLRRRATVLMQLDTGMAVGGTGPDA